MGCRTGEGWQTAIALAVVIPADKQKASASRLLASWRVFHQRRQAQPSQDKKQFRQETKQATVKRLGRTM